MSSPTNVIHVGNFQLFRLQREIDEKRRILESMISELRAYGCSDEEIAETMQDALELDDFEDVQALMEVVD